ncbi:MAG TPA: energy transducer TonB [Candidatus Paceibacterota bacterium]|nr:energy transducer TonB [Candidatus Paceibacterota bacterium]
MTMEAGVSAQRVRIRRRVLAGMGAILSFQIFLFWMLSDRTVPSERPVGSQSSFLLLTEPEASRQVALALAPLDPFLFASAHPQGFSGSAWLRPRHIPLEFQDWTEPDYWLAPDFVRSLFIQPETTAQPASSTLAIVDKFPPATGRIREHTEPLPLRSVLRTDGILRLCQEFPPDLLPVWTNQTTLQPTVIEIVANPEGEIISRRVLESSGLQAADQEATRLLKSLRIQTPPSPSTPEAASRQTTTLGRFIFDWAVIAPASTNQPAK